MRQLRVKKGTAIEQAEEQANQQALVLEAEQQELNQVVAVVVNNDILPFRHPQITMNGPPTTLSRQPYKGDIQAAKVDIRYIQMEKKVSRFVWKDEDEQKVANALVASLVDNLATVDLRSFICVSNISKRLKWILKDRLDSFVRAEDQKFQAWKEENRYKG